MLTSACDNLIKGKGLPWTYKTKKNPAESRITRKKNECAFQHSPKSTQLLKKFTNASLP